jgi:type IV secretion system protein VirD4
MKREKSKYAMLWFAIFVVGGMWAGLLAGVSTDGAVDEGGRIDVQLLEMPDMAEIETYTKVFDNESNARSGAIIGGFVTAIVLYQLNSNKKRLHRKGEEHGSATWASLAEKKKLADKGIVVGEKKTWFGSREIKKPYIYVELKLDGDKN